MKLQELRDALAGEPLRSGPHYLKPFDDLLAREPDADAEKGLEAMRQADRQSQEPGALDKYHVTLKKAEHVAAGRPAAQLAGPPPAGAPDPNTARRIEQGLALLLERENERQAEAQAKGIGLPQRPGRPADEQEQREREEEQRRKSEEEQQRSQGRRGK